MPAINRAMHTEESAEVEVLFANMEKLKTLTRKIQGSLSRLETSGRSVQDAIRPVYGNTSKLQITNKNIERINEAIDKIRQPMDRTNREKGIIKAGLQRVALPDYLACMDRIKDALGELTDSNLKSNQHTINELNELLRLGETELEDSFRDTLRSESKSIEPLHYITKQLAFPALAQNVSSKLRLINTYISSSARTSGTLEPPTATIFVSIRAPYIAQSLQNLATASVGTVRKTDPHAMYKPGTSGIGTYATAIEGIFVAEYDNVCPIFSRDQWGNIHGQACQDALNEFSRTLRELHTHIKNNIITDCSLAYEIVDIVSKLSIRLESRNPDLKQPVQEALRPVRETAKYSLQRLYEDTRSRVQTLMTLPSDCSPVGITFDTVARLQNMTAYLEPLSSILASVGEGGWRTAMPPGTTDSSAAPTIRSFDVGASGRDIFAAYLQDTLDALLDGLLSKAKSFFPRPNAQGVFLANNVAVVQRLVATSDLAGLLTEPARDKIDAFRQKALKLYEGAAAEACKPLLDFQYTNRTSQPGAGGNRPGSGSVDSAAFVKNMSSKDREAIKEKFRQFNIQFEELVGRHKGFKMESEVRPELAKTVAQIIEPMYVRFYDRYHEIDKGKGKYVKYDKAALSAALAGLA